MGRTAVTHRTTRETDVEVSIDLDGSGIVDVSTGVGFYDHLLSTFAHHGLFDLTVRSTGDLHIDEHHTVEDTALALGEALAAALGDRGGVRRFGDARVPMDEAWAVAAVDAGGRPYCMVDLPFHTERIGTLGTQMIEHALESIARTAGFTIHISGQGRNDHHLAEAAIKALGLATRAAVTPDPGRRGVASTKGTAS